MTNLDNWTNVTDLAQIPAMANTNTGGWFWAVITFMLFAVLTIVMSTWGFEVAILISGFVMLLISILLVYAGLVAWWVAMIYFGVVLLMIIYIIWGSNRDNY